MPASGKTKFQFGMFFCKYLRGGARILLLHTSESLVFPLLYLFAREFLGCHLNNFFLPFYLNQKSITWEKLRRGLVIRIPKCLAVATAALSWGSAEAM